MAEKQLDARGKQKKRALKQTKCTRCCHSLSSSCLSCHRCQCSHCCGLRGHHRHVDIRTALGKRQLGHNGGVAIRDVTAPPTATGVLPPSTRVRTAAATATPPMTSCASRVASTTVAAVVARPCSHRCCPRRPQEAPQPQGKSCRERTARWHGWHRCPQQRASSAHTSHSPNSSCTGTLAGVTSTPTAASEFKPPRQTAASSPQNGAAAG